MKIIQTILKSDLFIDCPPVLIDIGASGKINEKWKLIAPYSVCIAYDADDRDFRITEGVNSGYKKLISFNRVVTADISSYKTFYLTASPYCSSILRPDLRNLEHYFFKELFAVDKEISLPTISMGESLDQAGVTYVDWFKTDTQGTDLRLYTALSPKLRNGILAAEFEPGIMDAYIGEDKLYSIMQRMHQDKFWLSSMGVKGTQRLNIKYEKEINPLISKRLVKVSPCWAEMLYFKEPESHLSERQLLLLFIFSLIEEQYGFALELADAGMARFPQSFFVDAKSAVVRKLKQQTWKVPFKILKNRLGKVFIHNP